MATSVNGAFNQFYQNINLSGDHRETANSRKERIISLLKKDFEILDAFATGSIPRYTAVKKHADLDIMVVLHYGKHIKNKSPTQVLQTVRDSLGEYRTNVRKNGQAVTLHYESWPNVDIVPVSRWVDNNGKITHYEVPNMNDGTWIVSKPFSHTKNIDDRAKEGGLSFKQIIKMIKWWNYCHSEYLSSYHIEAMAYEILKGKIDEYDWNLYIFFEKSINLIRNGFSYLGNSIDSYLDWNSRIEIVKRLETARDKALQAWHLTYEDNNDHEKAIEIWKQIFGSEFPSYY